MEMKNSDIIMKNCRPKSKISVQQDKFVYNNISQKGQFKIKNQKYK